ncbi:MAG: OsmC family protein [Sphingobacteriales bacterium]|nr:OsmC family protein [Sphingobacteriales bacterium]
MKTTTVWKGEHRFESEHDGNRIRVDGDKKNGHGPKALLLSALAGCSGIDLVDILEKMRVEFSGLTMEAAAEQTEEHPKVFTGVEITYRLKTAAGNEDKVRKAIELSLEKYCGVAVMLRKNSPVNYKLIIE